MREPAITQHYWHIYRVEPVKAADKPRREKESFLQVLKKQMKSDPVTVTLECIAGVLIVVETIAQVMIWRGWM